MDAILTCGLTGVSVCSHEQAFDKMLARVTQRIIGHDNESLRKLREQNAEIASAGLFPFSIFFSPSASSFSGARTV
jgi:hypothetical protein